MPSEPKREVQPMDKGATIFVAGHRGLVGSAICRKLAHLGYANVLTRSRKEVDLTRQDQVEKFFAAERPAYVFLAAAKVGGILANDTQSGDFIRENLQIETNVIAAAKDSGAKKLMFLGSSCIYPKLAAQPMNESALMTGPLEPTNDAYAVAKIAGIFMCRAYRKQYGFDAVSIQPTNLYGPGDNFDLTSSHVLPALIRKFHEAKQKGAPSVVLWGTGTPRREFLHVDDMADASVHLMNTYSDAELVNVGVGEDVSIAELAALVQKVVGFKGTIEQDTSKPDGTPRKLLDVSKLTGLGWKARVPLEEGIRGTYQWFVENVRG